MQYPLLLATCISIIWIVWDEYAPLNRALMDNIVIIQPIVIGIVSLRFPISIKIPILAAFITIMQMLRWDFFHSIFIGKNFPGYGATIYLLLAVSILSSAKLATALLVMAIQ
jgi:hypothetical protein